MNNDAQQLARTMLDELGNLTGYALADEALDYLEGIRRYLRPIAWPESKAGDRHYDNDGATCTICGETVSPNGDEELESSYIGDVHRSCAAGHGLVF